MVFPRIGNDMTLLARDRAAKGWTQEALAQAAGVSRDTLSRMENWRPGAPGGGFRELYATKVAQALGEELGVYFHPVASCRLPLPPTEPGEVVDGTMPMPLFDLRRGGGAYMLGPVGEAKGCPHALDRVDNQAFQQILHRLTEIAEEDTITLVLLPLLRRVLAGDEAARTNLRQWGNQATDPQVSPEKFLATLAHASLLLAVEDLNRDRGDSNQEDLAPDSGRIV